MHFFEEHTNETIISGILLVVIIIVRMISTKLVRRFAKTSDRIEYRTNLVIKYIHILLNILAVIALIIIWGVNKDDILLTFSSESK